MPVNTTEPASPVVMAFLEAFAKTYAELRTLGADLTVTAPPCRATPARELERAFLLADRAARVWAIQAVENYNDAGLADALGFLEGVPPITNDDAARDAEGRLQAAFRASGGYSKIAIGSARDAADHAGEIESELPDTDNLSAARDVAAAAGACLAAAVLAKPGDAAASAIAEAEAQSLC